MPTWTYIYHVIGTLSIRHLRLSLESMSRQEFHWPRLVIHNASPIPMEEILFRLDHSHFDEIDFLEHPVDAPKSAAYDWARQMDKIGGTDFYLSHKADFVLADGVCQALETLGPGPWFLPFNKLDMKARATDEEIKAFASDPWDKLLGCSALGTYDNHLGKLAVPFEQGRPYTDGTMHAYSDEARAQYMPSKTERQMRWGWAASIGKMRGRIPFIDDRRFFACHVYHESPDRTDWNKHLTPEERF